MNPREVGRILETARSQRRQAAEVPVDALLELLDRMQRQWQRVDYAPRRAAEAALARETGFSPPMIHKVLRRVEALLDSRQAAEEVRLQLAGIPRSIAFQADSGSELRWYPLGTVLQVVAGNVPTIGVLALINGILTGNVNILKLPSGQTFLTHLVECILDCDETGIVARSTALLDFASTQKDVISAFKAGVDGLVVWGGEEAVRAYRDGLRSPTRLVAYGPKLSLALITAGGLATYGLERAADQLAREVAIWDQAACTAPQVCYVEGVENALKLTERLAQSLEEVSAELPPGRIDLGDAVEIQRLRAVHEVAEARGVGLMRCSRDGLSWTVILDQDPSLRESALHRTLRLIPLDDAALILPHLERWRGYVQTVGLMAADHERAHWCTEVAEVGAVRVVELGSMSGRRRGEPHDGRFYLQDLSRLVLRRDGPL